MCHPSMVSFPHGATAPGGPGPPHFLGFTMTLSHTTLDRTPLDECSARRRDLNLTKYNTHKRQTFMPPAGFDLTIPASERLQTHALDRAATGIGTPSILTECKVRLALRANRLSNFFIAANIYTLNRYKRVGCL